MRFTVALTVLGLALSMAFHALAQPAPRAPSPPRAGRIELSDEGELSKVVSLYEAGKYEECASALKSLLDLKSRQRLRDRAVVENARIYHAACLIGSGRPEAADEPLRAAIRDNMQMKAPDSLLFPPPVIERFLHVQQSLYDEIRLAEEAKLRKVREDFERRIARERAENERVRELERLATQEVIITKNRRWLAFLPFGVGQFQNGNDGLGWVFLTSEAVLGATALTSLGVYSHFDARARELQNPDNNAVVDTWFTLFKVNSYSFLAVAALGILEAQLSFVPEVREQRVRPLPPKLQRKIGVTELRPGVSAGADGVLFGVSGKF